MTTIIPLCVFCKHYKTEFPYSSYCEKLKKNLEPHEMTKIKKCKTFKEDKIEDTKK